MRTSIQQYPYDLGQSSVEPVGITFEDMLPTGQTVVSCTAALIDPNGNSTAVDGANIVVSTPSVTIQIGPFSSLGTYKLKPLAVCSGSAKLEMEIDIEVAF